MHVTIEHVFAGIQPASYEALYFDEAFNESLGRHLRMGRKLVRLDRSPERIVRHVRYEPAQAPGSEAKQAFGSSRASFLEELDYDPRERRGAWRTVPNMFPERVKNTGTIAFLDDGAGTKRVVEGDAIVRLFGLGGRVEKIIVGEIVKNYEASAAFTRDWLATH
ncbi:MAG: DUF2505 family protein [Kofleriaceae bacterium]